MQDTTTTTSAAGDAAGTAPAKALARRQIPWQAWFVVLGAVWGCSFWWIKVGLQALDPIGVAFIRLAFGAVALLAITALTRAPLPRRRSTWGHLFILGMLFNSLPFTLIAYGETHVSAILAGLINALTPLATLLAALAVFRQERATPTGIIGLLLGLAGVVVVIGIWRGLGSRELLGILACVAAVVCYGLAFPYSRRHLMGAGESLVGLATGQVLSGALQLLPFALVFGHVRRHPPVGSFVALGALGMLGTGVAYVLNFHIMSRAPATVASSVTYVVPLFAVAVGATFLGEPVAWYEPVGAFVILAGAAISQGRLRLPGRWAQSSPGGSRGA